jgi:uncharacterized membrane protein YkvA (DUF1232 family)
MRARAVTRDTLALYLAARDPRTPWYAKLFVGLIVAYALSPIDLIPDFIPVLGFLDDVVILPIGILLAVWMIPGSVLLDCRERALEMADRPTSPGAAIVIGLIWAGAAALAVFWLVQLIGGSGG